MPTQAEIDSCVLPTNLANLDTAFTNFWRHGRGFPQYKTRLDSFEIKTGRVLIKDARDNYATIYLPGIGDVKIHNSRDLSGIQKFGTSTIKREGGDWYISALVDVPDLPETNKLENAKSVVGIDVGVNKLVALSDGSFTLEYPSCYQQENCTTPIHGSTRCKPEAQRCQEPQKS
ncbi:hypothetical protein ACE1CM_36345 [Microseira sp. BLCC-F43]